MSRELLKNDEYDSPWKGMLDKYFREFMELLFVQMALCIDWSRGFESLDKEFEQIVRDAALGKRLADKLVKVWLKDGQQMVVYVHTEIQGEHDKGFEQRMFIYHYRIFDRYGGRVVSLAVLSDEGSGWRPSRYETDLWGCRLQFDFPIVKLSDLRSPDEWDKLEASANPFAKVVMAHLKTQDTKRDSQARKQSKMALTKSLYHGGFTKQQILDIYWFMDWVMSLPKEIEEQFNTELQEFEKEEKMTYVTTIERRGIRKGMQKGVQKGMQKGVQKATVATLRNVVLETLELRFHSVSYSIKKRLEDISDLDFLRRLHRLAVQADSMDTFEQGLDEG